MKSHFLAENAWTVLRKYAKSHKKPAHVAVAYFGKGGASLLPLSRNSRLVVDASEQAVKSGQTCPDELLKLQNKGVRIFSIQNLHAKVFVFGNKLIIGSTNVSNNSATNLVEAALLTTEKKALEEAKRFVVDHCLVELGPENLKRLSKMYVPPRTTGMNKSTARHRLANEANLPRVSLATLSTYNFPEEALNAADVGRKAAKRQMERPRTNEISEFNWDGKSRFKLNDVVVQVLDKKKVSRGGTVINTKKWNGSGDKGTWIFVEIPSSRWRNLDSLAQKLGRGWKKKLLNGPRLNLRDSALLLSALK